MTGRKHLDLRTSRTTSGCNKGNEATCREVGSEVLVDVFEGSWEVLENAEARACIGVT